MLHQIELISLGFFLLRCAALSRWMIAVRDSRITRSGLCLLRRNSQETSASENRGRIARSNLCIESCLFLPALVDSCRRIWAILRARLRRKKFDKTNERGAARLYRCNPRPTSYFARNAIYCGSGSRVLLITSPLLFALSDVGESRRRHFAGQ